MFDILATLRFASSLSIFLAPDPPRIRRDLRNNIGASVQPAQGVHKKTQAPLQDPAGSGRIDIQEPWWRSEANAFEADSLNGAKEELPEEAHTARHQSSCQYLSIGENEEEEGNRTEEDHQARRRID